MPFGNYGLHESLLYHLHSQKLFYCREPFPHLHRIGRKTTRAFCEFTQTTNMCKNSSVIRFVWNDKCWNEFCKSFISTKPYFLFYSSLSCSFCLLFWSVICINSFYIFIYVYLHLYVIYFTILYLNSWENSKIHS